MNKISKIAFFMVMLTLCLTAAPRVFAGKLMQPAEVKLSVNGVIKPFELYNLKGNNYCKLRDLALALENTPKSFNISWDGQKNCIALETGKPYLGAPAVKPSQYKKAQLAEYGNAALFCDGKPLPLLSFTIANANYFKLRDLAQALDIAVAWDEKAVTIALDTEHSYIPPKALPLAGRLICIDPGHGTFSKGVKEPIAPSSKELKNGFVTGTQGAKYTEAQVNLAVALLLKEKLVAQGAEILMTREDDRALLSNAGRAKLANDANVDMAIRIHCDGSVSSKISGMSMLVPRGKYVPSALAKISEDIGNAVLESTIAATGAKSRGIIGRDDLTGFNWSTVPSILIEMGFMTSPQDDKNLSTPEYQDKLASGMANGITEYFSRKTSPTPKLRF